ncbi:glycosyltransferase family 4 protein [Spirosoma gilvum]
MKLYINASFLSLKSITGISRFALAIAYELKKTLGDDVILLAPKNIEHPTIAKELEVIQINSFFSSFIKDLNKSRLIWEQTDLRLYLWKHNNPLLLSLSNTAPLLYTNQIVSILDLFYEHCETLLPNHYFAYPKREIQFYKYIIPHIAQSSKLIITISQYSKKDIADHFEINSKKIKVIYPTIPPIFLNQSATNRLPNKYGKYILGVSSVNPHKNFEGLIRAFQKANLPDVKLVIVGNVQMDESKYSLYHLYKDDPRIVFTGFISDQELISLYKHALFFAFLSFFEGFGIPPLEAMACGCPTLVSNAASLPEVCGEASLYINPTDVNGIVNAMLKLVNEPSERYKLVELGYKQVAKFNHLLFSKSVRELLSYLSD